MRKIGVVALGFLALLTVAAACVPVPEPAQPVLPGEATALPRAVATLSSDVSPQRSTSGSTESESSIPLSRNVAPLGSVSASTIDESGQPAVDTVAARLAADGDLDSIWNSKQFAPHWLSVVLDDIYLVDRIQLVVTQAPDGPTRHEVWVGDRSGMDILYKRFSNVHTEDGQILDIAINPPRNIGNVLIRTLASPSWVAWREVRVFGRPPPKPAAAEEAPLFELNPIASGLEFPVRVTHAGDGSGRMFVVEQNGRIRIVRKGHASEEGAARAVDDTPFLDISELVSCCQERGLLDVAFPPEYAVKKQFYVNYTDVDGHTTISRFKTTADPDRADPDSEEVLLVIEQPKKFHNGGRIVFGPHDGYLYIGSGDGGDLGDVDNNGQGSNTLLGKILRIDVESGEEPYGIPANNPFRQIEGYRDEIWALGLRNPWSFAFDKQTGDIFIPDVGNFRREEINYQPASSAGENYGWRIMEGNTCFEFLPVPCKDDGFISPAIVYDHSQGCAVVGGAVYRGPGAPGLQGVFLYSDYCRGNVRGLHRPDTESQDGWQSTLLIKAPFPISSIGEDEEGNVYVLGYKNGVVSMVVER